MTINEQMKLWNNNLLAILNIEWFEQEDEQIIIHKNLPTSSFIIMTKGEGEVCFNNICHTFSSTYIFHLQKKQSLEIHTSKNCAYFLVYYRSKNKALFTNTNYHFKATDHLSILEPIQQIYQNKNYNLALNHLYITMLAQQFSYQIYRQYHFPHYDLTSQVIHYFHQHFKQSLTLEHLAKHFHCSVSYLSKQFKENTNYAPMYYLGKVRIDAAIELLLTSDATLQEIAERTGHLDGYSLSRSFKKYTHLSPTAFKTRYRLEDLPTIRREFAILSSTPSLYTMNDIENNYQIRREKHSMMYQSMKSTLLALVMCLSIILTACNTTPAEKTEIKQEQQATETRVVKTPHGDVTIPANPKRVIADQYMGQLFKLGIIPVGVRSYMLSEAWFDYAGISQETLNQIEDLGGFPMNAEKMITLEPDLIIGSIEDNIEQYEKIGTTIFVPYWEELSTAGPIEKFQRIASLFGKENEADEWISDFNNQLTDAQKIINKHIKKDETVSVIQISSQGNFVLASEGGNYGSPIIYDMLKLTPTEQAKNIKDGFKNISLEVLRDYIGDHVFVYIGSEEDAAPVLESAVWKDIPAVKNGNAYFYGQMGDEFVMEDPYSLEMQLNKIIDVVENHK